MAETKSLPSSFKKAIYLNLYRAFILSPIMVDPSTAAAATPLVAALPLPASTA